MKCMTETFILVHPPKQDDALITASHSPQASEETVAESTGCADCTVGESAVRMVSKVLRFDGSLSLDAMDAMLISFLLASRKLGGGIGLPTAPRCSNSRILILFKPCASWIEAFDTTSAPCIELQCRRT
ncbi:hypothetical protein BC939DRAFT_477413 [Gamsiella multidivaricata]|uniref:uncharacterized protein n=1 Tax=Gamsiella multidivaricata TaxID=101098 RepID=UPI002220E160|nr:uncharacterized protein BC939DRAFT_477413 [Gamsiella multidivaricata]KAI7822978.1 hypothetical protein BC939DRAFT_477413 [Gamsiella multidivaricata]